MGDGLDLYSSRGTRSWRWNWKATAALVASALVVAGAAGYRWMTDTTPITQQQVLDLYRAERGDEANVAPRDRSKRPSAKRPASKSRATRDAGATAPGAATGAAESIRSASAQEGRAAEPAGAGKASSSGRVAGVPEEGVYSWSTRGYEQAAGARRSLPEESQRVITRDARRGWTQHHYFSEEREAWTQFRILERGASITYQRNKVRFGPVTNDSTVTFDPPMLVGPSLLRVGDEWSGSWRGRTSGSYEGETFERRRLTIGGVDVEVWGVHVVMEMRGEVSGTVDAKVWISPEYRMTVREDFDQDVEAGVGRYRAEWTMTLKSLDPRR